jgi:hypothetical protein
MSTAGPDHHDLAARLDRAETKLRRLKRTVVILAVVVAVVAVIAVARFLLGLLFLLALVAIIPAVVFGARSLLERWFPSKRPPGGGGAR